jgi:hypothetical protein
MNDIKNSIERLRKRLLDLSGRNKSISFKHSSKSKKQLRFVNISISDFYKKMLTNEKIEIVGLPVPDLEPNDEKTEQFQKILTKRKLTDVKYLEELGEFSEKNISLKKKNEIENKLRDRLRLEMNMSPVSRVRPKEEETAKKLGISIEFDLKSIKDSNKSMPLQTMYYEDDLNALLSGLIDERKLIESESGLVPMYLALGFLEWLESESTDKNFLSRFFVNQTFDAIV